jgi:hypothetical protein
MYFTITFLSYAASFPFVHGSFVVEEVLLPSGK